MTDNLERRLVEHNDKTLSFWTKIGTNWKLVYTEEFESKPETQEKSGLKRVLVENI